MEKAPKKDPTHPVGKGPNWEIKAMQWVGQKLGIRISCFFLYLKQNITFNASLGPASSEGLYVCMSVCMSVRQANNREIHKDIQTDRQTDRQTEQKVQPNKESWFYVENVSFLKTKNYKGLECSKM